MSLRCEECGRPIRRNASHIAATATHGPRHQTCQDRLPQSDVAQNTTSTTGNIRFRESPDGGQTAPEALTWAEYDRIEAGFTLCMGCQLHHWYLAEGECGTYMASLPGFRCEDE